MKKVIVALAAVVLIAVLIGVLWLKGKTFTVEIPEADIQAKMNESLPITKDYVFFEVTLADPRIDLQDGSDRIHGGLDIIVDLTFGDEQSFRGSIDMDTGLRYDPDQGAFFLSDPIIERFEVSGFPEEHASKARAALEKLLQYYVERNPVYKLSDFDLKQKAAKMFLKDIVVADEKVIVTLGI